MKSLKSRFGKFAVSNEKMAQVNGGLVCYANGGKNKSLQPDAESAKKWCAARPSCYGCF